jgi:catalase
MSDRAIPRSYRMMQGFGVHTFRLVDAAGRARLCKFHWRPLLGTHSLVWDEAQKLQGKDPDFHRRDLWDAIESGAFPQYELGVQVVDEKDAQAYGFDLLDPTKLLPEEQVPVEPVGLLTLDRNPTNFFAETEQVAFHVGNLVPGIDVTNDPLLQARLFSYLDTQLTRLGGPNFAEIPINRPLVPVSNHQQDGAMRMGIPNSRALYHPNTVAGGLPALAPAAEGGFVHFAEPVSGEKNRRRSESFLDHFTQARVFLLSLSAVERGHLTDAFRFEIAKVKRRDIRMRVLAMFAQVDQDLAESIAEVIGESAKGLEFTSRSGPARKRVKPSPALSMTRTAYASTAGRRLAILAADGVDGRHVAEIVREALRVQATVQIVAPALGALETSGGPPAEACCNFMTAESIFFDAVIVPGGRGSAETLAALPAARRFIAEAWSHSKTIAAIGEGRTLVRAGLREADAALPTGDPTGKPGVLLAPNLSGFTEALLREVSRHRHWDRFPPTRD